MKDDVAVKISHVSKNFVLPHEKTSSLKGAFTSLLSQKGKSTKQVALKDINFEIKKGEFFGIVGRNGSGKSTLLKIIAGIYQPTKGSVRVNGKLVPFIELGVGFNPELTGRENVYLNGAILGFTRKEIENNYENIVKFAELEEHMDVKLKNYSSGMQVRLAFACATRAEADILLIDEVLAVGDADFQRKCFNYFKRLKRTKKTVVFVTHDMNAVQEYCDRAMFVNDSTLVEIGKPVKISKLYNQLFNEQNQSKADEELGHWGNQKMLIDKVNVGTQESSISISYDVIARVKVTKPIYGFRIRSSDGEPILGTNSKIKKYETVSIGKDDTAIIKWEFSNILSDGNYVVDLAVVEQDGTTVMDWWDGAAEFKVYKTEKVPYSINPHIDIRVEKRNGRG